jgi:hypothetical protein
MFYFDKIDGLDTLESGRQPLASTYNRAFLPIKIKTG